MDQNRCWTTLKYTKPHQLKTTPVLKDFDGNITISMKVKEDLVHKSTFPKPISLNQEPIITSGIAHKSVTEVEVAYALMSQSATKAPGPDEINFQILRMI